MSKCQWGQTRCEFLGHVVGNGLVSPAEGKIEAVRSFALPTTKKQIRQFLGLTGYYRRFVPKYAEHSFELTEATRKSAPERILWNDCMYAEYYYLKDSLCALPSLTLPVPSDQFVLQTDASGIGLGAVLSVTRDGEELPVAFYSRKLQPRECKYSATELEGLAVVAAVSLQCLPHHPCLRRGDRPQGPGVSQFRPTFERQTSQMGGAPSTLYL